MTKSSRRKLPDFSMLLFQYSSLSTILRVAIESVLSSIQMHFGKKENKTRCRNAKGVICRFAEKKTACFCWQMMNGRVLYAFARTLAIRRAVQYVDVKVSCVVAL